MSARDGQKGQILPLFALTMVLTIGLVAISVDYAVLVNQHRNIQAYVDEAASAATQKLDPASPGAQTSSRQRQARLQAFVYLRDNLLNAAATPSSALPVTALPAGNACGGGNQEDLSAAMVNDVKNCTLPAPLSNYTISICTPGDINRADGSCLAANQDANRNTVSILVRENVSNAFAAVIGSASSIAGAYAEAQYGDAALPFALFSHGCVTTGNQLEVVGGDVYIDTCTLQGQSGGKAAFCAESSGAQSGNIVFGPLANVPAPAPLANQTLAACEAAAGGALLGMGSVYQRAQSVPVPSYTEPPGYTAAAAFIAANTPGSALHDQACVNGSVGPNGSPPSDCFSPGVYSDVSGIANNLNPGVYYVTGNCAPNASGPCTSVTFTGNTMNANWANVADQCWNKVVAAGQFSPPCPTGFIQDPTSVTITDPQCTGSTQTPLLPPTFTVAAGTGGHLGSATAAKYFVRVTAVNNGFESLSNEQSAVVTSASGAGALNLNIVPVPGATSYNVYVSSSPDAVSATTGNDEQFAGATASAGATSVFDLGLGSSYPVFDTSSCTRGFHNVPRTASFDRTQNWGVTFVLLNNASIDTSSKNTVLLSPFCSSLQSDNPPKVVNLAPATPPVPAGTPCRYAETGAYANDGAFVIYAPGPGIGSISSSKLGTYFGASGTILAPTDDLSVTSNGQFAIMCGQGIFRTVGVQSGNHGNPSFYYPCSNTVVARPANGVKLIR